MDGYKDGRLVTRLRLPSLLVLSNTFDLVLAFLALGLVVWRGSKGLGLLEIGQRRYWIRELLPLAVLLSWTFVLGSALSFGQIEQANPLCANQLAPIGVWSEVCLIQPCHKMNAVPSHRQNLKSLSSTIRRTSNSDMEIPEVASELKNGAVVGGGATHADTRREPST